MNDLKKTFTHNIIKEFPPIIKKTRAWHSYNKCVRTRQTTIVEQTSPYVANDQTQCKLSLKKQIWTGTHSDSSAINDSNGNYPLSWGIPIMRMNDCDALLK